MDIIFLILNRLRYFLRDYVPQVSTKIECLPSDIPDRMVEYSFVLRELNLRSGRVLDVGCTSPFNVLPLVLAEQGLEVWGLDLREFKIQHPNFRFVAGDVRETHFPNDYFDRIIAVSTIEHIGLKGRYSPTMDPTGDRKAIRND